ncbi:TetR family transcriptional regulator [Pokkaliibacter plantistimulans]|uniref:TetR family transcriptional regulator n=1 Tax=Proteobacteria bacterium 228 TaxID=2083153 RepID=A0A2S5KVY0_9PROT|nr:TetR/AcrR family transcriptional regulator [Pokkaliibacter plantistimulans]PPC78855.1 TetR family transcriptional regulator [Pokkaliibacter plantistimulans]
MDNPSRSERSRTAILQAALAIISREGPGRLTLDAIAKESGMSKGGLMHQFPNKTAVLKALIEYQVEHFEAFYGTQLAAARQSSSSPVLASRIATAREATHESNSIALALLGAAAQEPGLLSISRDIDVTSVEQIKAEATDPDLALLRWSAARGLSLSVILGICPLSEDERNRLFERLLDDGAWQGTSAE